MRHPSLSPLRLSIISEAPEHDCDGAGKLGSPPGSHSPLVDSPRQLCSAYSLNLGTESPDAIMKSSLNESPRSATSDEWRRNGIAVHTNVPMRKRHWRSSSFSEKLKRGPPRREHPVYNDCGICDEVAVVPCRMLCCSKSFCLEHITDWLYGPTSDGRCPSCKTLCNFVPENHPSPSGDSAKDTPSSDSTSQTGRPVIFLLMQASSGSADSATDPHKKSDTPAIRVLGFDNPRPVIDSKTVTVENQGAGFQSNSPIVLLSRMMGRVLSIVGLILFLLILLS